MRRNSLCALGTFVGSVVCLVATGTAQATKWTQQMPGVSPSERGYHAMAYDIDRDRVVLFGGFNGSTSVLLGDTWEYDGTTWTNVTPANSSDSPSPRWGHAMVFDTSRRGVLLHGGWDGTASSAELWEWTGTIWQPITTSSPPPARHRHAMAYDSINQQLVVFGGRDNINGSGSTVA